MDETKLQAIVNAALVQASSDYFDMTKLHGYFTVIDLFANYNSTGNYCILLKDFENNTTMKYRLWLVTHNSDQLHPYWSADLLEFHQDQTQVTK